MRQIQLYKVLISIILFSLVFSKHVKPNGKEELYKLSGISNNSTRSYYKLDDNGLSYSNFKKYVKNGENAVFKIISRSQIAPNSNSKKSFGYKLIIKKGKKTIFSKELKYNKRASNVSSSKQKGFYFTEAGFWIEELKITDKTKIILKPLNGSSDAFIRLVVEQSKQRKTKDSKKIKTLNRNKSYSIKFDNNDNKVNKSRNWIMIDNKYGEKFKIEGPATIRVFSRYMIDNNADKNIDSYVMKFYEDEKWVSEFDVNIVKSIKNARIVNKGFDDYDLSKFKSFYYNVPSGTHYYTVKIPVASEDNKFIFKVEEYEIK